MIPTRLLLARVSPPMLMLPLLAAASFSSSGCTTDSETSERATGEIDHRRSAVTPGTVTTVAPVALVGGPAKASPRSVWLIMKQPSNVARSLSATVPRDWRGKGRTVVDTLTQTATTAQAAIVADLQARGTAHKPFWIVNAVKVTADQATIDDLGKRADVAQVIPDRTFSLPPLSAGAARAAAAGVEWGLENIRATAVWDQFGAKGQGIIVANIDSGVQFDHPALVRQYRGNAGDGGFDHNYNWFDPANGCGESPSSPCDTYDHGTHTMGTMVGDDGAGNQIGVAPGARWIAAKACESNVCSTEALLAAGQWILAPTDLAGQNPRPDLRPHIVSNSWGGPGGDFFFQSIVQAWVAAGIFPVFANGNTGPYCYSASSPADYPESYAVGAYDSANVLGDFSSRGPGWGGLLKPNIAAPGVDVRSSVRGSAYAVHSGTSMAAPHLAGAVALLWSAAPILIGDVAATRQLLDRTAIDTADLGCGGTNSNNNGFGEGRLDIAAAVAEAPIGPTGTLRGTVIGPDGAPVAGAQVALTPSANAAGSASPRSAVSDATGAYSVRLLTGTYDVRVTAFGFQVAVITGVAITADTIAEQNVTLSAAPRYTVSGLVRTVEGIAVPGAKVTVVGTPLAPVVADGAGRYSVPNVPKGEYDLAASSNDGCLGSGTGHAVVASNATANIKLPRRSDGFGYFCREIPSQYVPGEDVLSLSGSGVQTSVALPFTFNLYGRDYTALNVTSSGFLNFLPIGWVPFDNYVGIPAAGEPDAAVFPFWDALELGPAASVRTKALGSAPNREFVVEWRGVTVAGDFGSPGAEVSFEVILSENGEMRMNYQSAEGSDIAKGGSATIGLEDEAGSTGFQYSFNRPVLRSGQSVLYSFPPSGIVSGTVTNLNTGAPVAGAEVRAFQRGKLVRATKTNASGGYAMRLPVGSHTLEIHATDYATGRVTVTVTDRGRTTRDISLRTGRPVISPATIQVAALANQIRTRTLTLSNTGSTALQFEVLESGGLRQEQVGTSRLLKNPSFNLSSKTTRGLFANGVAPSGLRPLAVGDVLRSFAPEGIEGAYGIGYTGKVWLHDWTTIQDIELTTMGAPTGVSWSTPWAFDLVADMAYDAGRNLLCHVNVGGDNGIYCTNPNTGELAHTIAGSFPWTTISQRGLAYRPDDDSFYIGGFYDGTIYHIRGLGSANPGEVISSCRPDDGTISGLAYNASMGVLWVGTNTDTDTIYAMNPDDCTVLSTVAHPRPGYNGAGLDLDENGNLWTVAQFPLTAYLIDSGVPTFTDVPWLSVAPASGTVAAGAKRNLSVRMDTTGLSPGLYLGSVFVRSSPALEKLVRVPVSLLVTDYQQGVNAGGNAYVDQLGDPWAADRAFSPGSWGYTQPGRAIAVNRTIAGTSDQPLARTQRQNPLSYAFDNVPNGTYRVDLDFAELQNVKAAERVFDVIIEDSVVLPAYDVASRLGPFTAERHAFVVNVTDGRLDVRLDTKGTRHPPMLNAVRVTHLTDR